MQDDDTMKRSGIDRAVLDRRAFLKGGGIALFSAGVGPALFGPAFLARAARATTTPASRPKILVAIFQRGAMDGLAAVAPTDQETQLAALRPNLAMSAARRAAEGVGDGAMIDLDNGFALHPALAPLMPLWRDNAMAIVHGVGSPDPSRSHFDAQAFMESGTPGQRSAEGWLNRVVGHRGHEASPMRGIAMASRMPRAMAGPAPTMTIADLDALRVPEALATEIEGASAFEQLYGDMVHAEGTAGAEALEAARILSQIDGADGVRGDVRYPPNQLGTSLAQIARLIKADIGLEVAFTSSGGWDTHVFQGTVDGSFARRARVLAQSIGAFYDDLGALRDDVVLVTMTEFGRTAIENGSGGTDHGHGSCLFVVGGGIDGGQVHGSVPALDPDALYDGRDLPVTTDFRSVMSTIADRHLGIADAGTLFPGWSGPRTPLWRPIGA